MDIRDRLLDFIVEILSGWLGRCLDCLWRVRQPGSIFCAGCSLEFERRRRRN